MPIDHPPFRSAFTTRFSSAGSAGVLFAATLSIAVAAASTPSAAQTPPDAATQRRATPAPDADDDGFPPAWLTTLRSLPYDLAERGPLLAVIPEPLITFPYAQAQARTQPPPTRYATLAALTTATNTKLFSAGGMNVLAPRTLTVINTKPGKANPFGNLSPADTLKLLLSTFTPAQWKVAGSATGIGAGDLTDDQKVLWAQMLPETAQIQTSKLEAGDAAGSVRYAESKLSDVHPRDTGRLRLSKSVTFSFYKPGANDTSWGGDPYMGRLTDQIGQTQTTLLPLTRNRDTKADDSAYGVPLLLEQTNRPKIGAVDFAAPVLDKRIALNDFPPRVTGAANKPAPPPAKAPAPLQERFQRWMEQAQQEMALLPTVGDLLQRVTKATGVEFVADRRVRGLPVYMRGESARAGDVLTALALSVGGTFRKMDATGSKPGETTDTMDTAPLYLLTDDVEGIGSRVARLAEWAEAAEELKRRVTEKADEAAAKNDPLAYLSFAPNDGFALTTTQTKRVEDRWRKEKYASPPDMTSTELSPALRKAVQDFVNERADEGISLRADRVQVGEELRPYLLLPETGNRALEAQELGWAIRSQYIAVLAFDPAKKPAEAKAAKTAPPAPGFAAPALKNQRRILIARPKTGDEAIQIVRAAIGRGIPEVWLEAGIIDPKASAAMLTKATEAGGKKIAVGALVRLLREKSAAMGNELGEPDRNILGETGDEHRARAMREHASDKAALAYYENELLGFAGWRALDGANAPDANELRRRVSLIANVPNLAGLTFRATGGPGWTGQKQGGDALSTNTAQGYTASMRRAFLRSFGMDPIDIPDSVWQLQITWHLGYFTIGHGQDEYDIVGGKAVRRSADAIPLPSWWSFRRRRSAELMASLFKSVRTVHPTLPLYIDDQISSYASSNTDWFGSWNTPEGLPNTNPYFGESDTRAAARRTSRTIFAHWWLGWDADDAAKPSAPGSFARQVSEAARQNPPPGWDGLVIELSDVPGASVPDLLKGLPKTTTAP